jgi:hypothetical protein
MAFFDGSSPSASIILQLRALLGQDGVLICANLPLVAAGEARILDAEFGNPRRWLRVGAIEDGDTGVFRKQAGSPCIASSWPVGE